MELKAVIKFILDTETESDIDAIRNAIQARKQRDAIALRCSLKVGDVVWFNEKTKPRYMVGQKATVKKINRERVVVDLVQRTARFSTNVNVPLSLLSTTAI